MLMFVLWLVRVVKSLLFEHHGFLAASIRKLLNGAPFFNQLQIRVQLVLILKSTIKPETRGTFYLKHVASKQVISIG